MALGAAIDRDTALATRLDPFDVEVERGRLRFFASCIGENDPVYTDVGAARAAGHPDLPVPPTFLFGLEMDGDVLFPLLTRLGVDLRHVLHGEQRFVYHAIAHAGDVLTLSPRVADVYTKRDGALTFLVKRTDVTRGDEPIAAAESTIVVRNPGASR